MSQVFDSGSIFVTFFLRTLLILYIRNCVTCMCDKNINFCATVHVAYVWCIAFLLRKDDSKATPIPSISDSQTMKKNPFKVFYTIICALHCLQCFDAVGWVAGRASACKKLSCSMLAWLCVWSRCRFASLHIAPNRSPCQHPTSHFLQAGCHCHSLPLAPENPDWFYLPDFTFLVPAHPGSPRQNPRGP